MEAIWSHDVVGRQLLSSLPVPGPSHLHTAHYCLLLFTDKYLHKAKLFKWKKKRSDIIYPFPDVYFISFWPLWLYLQIIKHVLGLWRTHSWSSHPCHWFETSHTVLRGVEGGKGALPATTLRHHILLTTEREKLHLHTLHSRWPPNNVRQDALQRETKRWRQTSTAHKNHKVRRLDAPRWSATRFQEHKRYIIVFITIIVIFHFIFAQKKTNK